MIVRQGEIYFDESHVKALKGEPEYVKRRYQAVVKTLVPEPFHITRRAAAEMIGRSLRHFYRILKRFKEYSILGLRFRSKRPKRIPNRTPRNIEKKILAVRKASGFGPGAVSAIVNESNRREGIPARIYPSLTYNILVRNGEIEREKRIQKKWKRFEWGHPNRLIQADLTDFNKVPLLTMEDDHSRKGWALVLRGRKDKTVIAGMKKLIQVKYDNLLTDNGSQFSRRNSEIRKYCDEHVNENHIWTSIHHPQTLGKLSAFQKGLKRFLRHRMNNSRNRTEIQRWIKVYINWYNNGKYHSGIDTYPEMRYSGQCDNKWYDRLVKTLKLEDVLSLSTQRGDISP
jgi:hypothetical protein